MLEDNSVMEADVLQTSRWQCGLVLVVSNLKIVFAQQKPKLLLLG